MKKIPLALSSAALCAGLVCAGLPGAAFAATPGVPDAPTVTSSVAEGRATLTIHGLDGAHVRVFDDQQRMVAGTTLVNGAGRVTVPAPDGVLTPLYVTQQSGTSAESTATPTAAEGAAAAALGPVGYEPETAIDTASGTRAPFIVTGRPGAAVIVKNSSGQVLAARVLDKGGLARFELPDLGRGATDISITQRIGYAESPAIHKRLMAGLLGFVAADTGSLAYYDATSRVGFDVTTGTAVAVDARGRVVASSSIKSARYLEIPHTPGAPETFTLYREVDGVRSEGQKITLTGAPTPVLDPPVVRTDSAASSGDDAVFTVRLAGAGGTTLRGGRVDIVTASEKVLGSVVVPADARADLSIRIPKSVLENAGTLYAQQTFHNRLSDLARVR